MKTNMTVKWGEELRVPFLFLIQASYLKYVLTEHICSAANVWLYVRLVNHINIWKLRKIQLELIGHFLRNTCPIR